MSLSPAPSPSSTLVSDALRGLPQDSDVCAPGTSGEWTVPTSTARGSLSPKLDYNHSQGRWLPSGTAPGTLSMDWTPGRGSDTPGHCRGRGSVAISRWVVLGMSSAARGETGNGPAGLPPMLPPLLPSMHFHSDKPQFKPRLCLSLAQ